VIVAPVGTAVVVALHDVPFQLSAIAATGAKLVEPTATHDVAVAQDTPTRNPVGVLAPVWTDQVAAALVPAAASASAAATASAHSARARTAACECRPMECILPPLIAIR